MSVTLSLFAGAGAQFFDNNGNVLSGGKIYTYQAGTTTPLATYTSNSESAFHTNPIILDAAGRVPSGGEIWLTLGVGYKFVLKTSAEVLIATYDNIPSSAQPPAANDADSIMYEQGYTVTAGSFVAGKIYRILSAGTTDFTLIGAVNNTAGTHFIATGAGTGTGTAELSQTVEAKLQQTVSVKDFGAVGDNVADDTAAIQAAINSNVSGLSVYFPHGRYRITSTIIVPTNKSLKMYGDGFNPQDLTPIFGSIVMWDGAVNGTMFSSNTNDGLNLSGWVIKDLRMDGGNKASIGLVSSALGAHPQHHYFENVEIANFAINGSDPALDLAGSPVSRFGVADATFINCIFSGGARAVRINCQQLNFFSCTFGAKSGGTLIELGDNAHPKFFGCGFYGSPGVDCVFGIQTAIGIDGLQCYGCWNEGQLRLLARLPGLPFVPAVGALRVLFSGQRSACDPAGAAGFMIDLRGLGCNLVWEGGSNDNVSSARVAIEDGSSMTVYGLSAGAFDFASVTGGGNALEYANGGVRLYGGDGVNSNYALRNNVAITALNTAKTFRANLIKMGVDDIINLGDSATGTPTRLYKGPSANFYAPSASMDGVIGVNETLGELVFYVNGQRFRVAGTAY
jgi:hypothetical protein